MTTPAPTPPTAPAPPGPTRAPARWSQAFLGVRGVGAAIGLGAGVVLFLLLYNALGPLLCLPLPIAAAAAGWAVGGWFRAEAWYAPDLHERLHALVHRHGPALWADDWQGQALVRAALSDYPRPADLLSQALHWGTPARLHEVKGEVHPWVVKGQAGRLVLQGRLHSWHALWAVCTWAHALGKKPHLPPEPRTRAVSAAEAVHSWLSGVLVLELCSAVIAGCFALLLGGSFLAGVFGGLVVVTAGVLAVTAVRVWLWAVRALLLEWIPWLDRDAALAEKLLEQADDATVPPPLLRLQRSLPHVRPTAGR